MNHAEFHHQRKLLTGAVATFKDRFTRAAMYGDHVRFTLDDGAKIYLMYDGSLVLKHRVMNPFMQHIIQELRFFVEHQELWYSEKDTMDRYAMFDLIIVKVPTHFYPPNTTDFKSFDEKRPCSRFIGGTPKGKRYVNAYRGSEQDIMPEAQLSFTKDPSYSRQFIQSLGLDSCTIADPPYDQPIGHLIYWSNE